MQTESINSSPLNPVLKQVTQRIKQRSAESRKSYLAQLDEAAQQGPARGAMGCSNLAHGFAACGADTKRKLSGDVVPNLAIITAYNDMLSAHQPYEKFPAQIRQAAEDAGAVAQVAGGVPAMCDGVTQGRPGMELSLFSRDVIAMSTAVSLSHDMFDAALCLGICDKIVPGLLIGALSFGHLPTVFVPAGPMPSGLSNKDKAAIRQAFAAGKVGRDELLESESAAYHSAGTCTFYGTANSNQMIMEFLGLQLPGGSFVNPGTSLREALTVEAVQQAVRITRQGGEFMPVGRIVDEAAIVNAVVGLLTTGGSTNHTMHLVAIAAAAGIILDWEDFADLAEVVPLLAQVYPNGQADVNHFHAAGGLGFVIRELLSAGLLNPDVNTIVGRGLHLYTQAPSLHEGRISWSHAPENSGDEDVVRSVTTPFQPTGGLKVLGGDIGRAVAKVSAVDEAHHCVEAPARVFRNQSDLAEAFERSELAGDMVAVVTHQGPLANGMPELHKLTPYLGLLQDKGYKVALLTDGRMSGASGKILAGIQVTPEAALGGLIGRIQDGDIVRVDAENSEIRVFADLKNRPDPEVDLAANSRGTGRELFGTFRKNVSAATVGASVFLRNEIGS